MKKTGTGVIVRKSGYIYLSDEGFINFIGSKIFALLLLITTMMLTKVAIGQQFNLDNEKWQLEGVKNPFVWIDLAPDQHTLAISSHQSFPLFLFNINNKQIIKQFDVGNWYAGARINYSPDGSNLLLQQLFYIDFAPNKDREVRFEVADAQNGKVLFELAEAHDLKFMPDSKSLLSLQGDEVSIIDIASGKRTVRKTFENASNSLDADLQGRYIAVAVHPEDKRMLANVASLRKDKKALKFAKSFKQMVVILDASTFAEIATIPELYDQIFRLEFSDNGKYLFVYHTPHTRKAASATHGRQSYVSIIDVANKEAMRTTFLSTSDFEACFRMHPQKPIFGIETKGKKFPEIHLYDVSTGSLLDRYELSYRLFENMGEGEFKGDGRASFEFLPDHSVLIVFGNRLIQWKPTCLE